MSRNIYNNPNQQAQLVRENSLPTYEEATGKIQRTAPHDLASVHPTTRRNNANERVSIDDDLLPTHQWYAQSSRAAPPVDTSSRNIADVDRGLQQPAQHPDPVVRQMAQTVLAECERARRKRENKQMAQCIGLIIGIIFGIILFASKVANSRR